VISIFAKLLFIKVIQQVFVINSTIDKLLENFSKALSFLSDLIPSSQVSSSKKSLSSLVSLEI
jgi:hypothetical protein